MRYAILFLLIISRIVSGATESTRGPSSAPPKYSWEELSASADFKTLPAEKRLVVLKSYSKELADYLKSIPGSNSEAIDVEIASFIEKQSALIVEQETARLLPRPPAAAPFWSVAKNVATEHALLVLCVCGTVAFVVAAITIGWRKLWRFITTAPVFLVAFFACLFLITPWRESNGRNHRALGYRLLFVAPTQRSEIDVTRYAVQVFAGSGIVLAIYLARKKRQL
jgi:hypothetical protein